MDTEHRSLTSDQIPDIQEHKPLLTEPIQCKVCGWAPPPDDDGENILIDEYWKKTHDNKHFCFKREWRCPVCMWWNAKHYEEGE